jgi:hypothetical protein
MEPFIPIELIVSVKFTVLNYVALNCIVIKEPQLHLCLLFFTAIDVKERTKPDDAEDLI